MIIAAIFVAVLLGLLFMAIGVMMLDSAITGPPTVADPLIGLAGLMVTLAPPVYGIYLLGTYLFSIVF